MVTVFVYTSVSTFERRIKSSNQIEAFDLRDTLVRLSCRVGVLFVSVPAHGGEPVLRIIAHFWRSFERPLALRHMEYSSLAQTTCKSLSEIFKHRVGFS